MAEEEKKEEEKKEKKCECPQGAPLWMVTYSDLVTLLLTFFVLLLSMASMDPVRFTEASSSLKDAFGMHNVPAHVDFAIPILPSPPVTKFSPVSQEMTKKIYERIKSELEKLKLNKDVSLLQKDSDTILLRINDSVLFQPGQSKVAPLSYSILRNISSIIRPLPLTLRIEGHTDNRPIGDKEIDNWDLSVARAVSVMRFFTQGELLQLDRMSAVGYGPQRPVASNKTDEGRAKNRRVDFILRLKNKSRKPTDKTDKIPL